VPGIQDVLLEALRKQNVPQAKGLQACRLYALLGDFSQPSFIILFKYDMVLLIIC
jgi:hypothetical protein